MVSMKLSEYTQTYSNRPPQKIEFHIEETDEGFAIGEINAVTKDVETSIDLDWPVAESIYEFLGHHIRNAQARDGELTA
jgi:hypothetical protein